MNFDLSQDQKLLVNTAAAFAKKPPVDRLRRLRWTEPGWDPQVWKQMADQLGWLGLPFPEDVGGYGGRFIDVCLLLEQLGTTLVPEPYLASVVLGGMAVLRAGDDAQRKRWLGPLIDGASILALAWAERESRYDAGRLATTVVRDGRHWRVDGEKVFVLAGHAADVLIVSARAAEGGVSLFAIDRGMAGVQVQSIKTMDGHRAATVRLEGVKVGDDRLLGAPGGGLPALEAVLDLGAAACVAEGLGICQRVLDLTVNYLKTRVQFDTVIGSFQVLQHRAVNMFVQVETGQSMAILAGLRADSDDAEERARAVSAAKVQLGTGGRFVTAQGIQLHGGVGITDEHDIGLYFKRMQVLATLCGDEEFHVNRFASLPGFAEGAA